MTDLPDGAVLATITITRVLTGEPGDENDMVHTQAEGNPAIIDALGMLELARDAILKGELFDD